MQGQISAGGLIVGGMIGQRGAPGNGIVSITYKSSSGLEDTYEVLYTNGETDDIVVTNGAEGNGISSITKTSSVGLVDTYTILYTNGSSDTIEVHNGEKGDKGDTGATGATPNLTIGSVTKGADASATITGTTDNPVLNLVLPKGDKGDKGDTGNTGATGNGIYSVTKTGTADLVDTYTILYTNGETTTFTITNGAKGDTGATGNGISTITKTGTAGLVDTYTITFTDGTTTTFDVTNGADGSVTDVQVEGTSVVDNGVANIVGLATQEELDRYKTIYNVLPKVNGEGESLSLNNTGESILKTTLKGNTSQLSTTGKNLIPNNLVSTTTSGVTFTKNDDGSIKITGTASARVEPDLFSDAYNPITFAAGTYKNTSSRLIVLYANGYISIDANGSTTISEDKLVTRIYFRVENGEASLNETYYPQIILSSVADTSYEPYTGGIASPNPDYPQQIHEVSGDNEINVCGRNLAYTGWAEDFVARINDSSKATITTKDNRRCLYWVASAGYPNYDTKYTFTTNWKENTQYTILFDLFVNSSNGYGDICIEYTDGTKQEINGTYNTWVHKTTTSTSGKTIKNIHTYYRAENSYIDLDTFMVYEGTETLPYEPYNGDTYELSLGDIKMRGIGTYEDYFVRNSGKNILDFDAFLNYSNVTYTKNDNIYNITNRGDIISNRYPLNLKPNTTYTLSCKEINNGSSALRVQIYEDSTYICRVLASGSSEKSVTFKTNDSSSYYMNMTNSGDTTYPVLWKQVMLEEGYVVSTYEPYGTGQWCKYNAIEEVVLDGSETNLYQDRELTNTWRYYTANILPSSVQDIAISDKFISVNAYNINNTDNEAICRINEKQIAMRLNKSRATTLAEFRTWLSTHNTQVKYVLASPYLLLIESNTLIEQLDAIEKALGKDGQTNISQVNNDAPFKIYASALMKISGE